MSSRTAAARKRLQDPLLKAYPSERAVNQARSFVPSTQPDISLSPSPLRDAPRMHTSNQALDLSNEFIQPLPSPEYSPSYYFPPSNHVKFQNTEPAQAVQAVSSYGPSPQTHFSHKKSKKIEAGQVTLTYDSSSLSPHQEDIRQRRPILRVDPHAVNHQNLPPPSLSPRLASLKSPSPATGYVPNLPIPLYPPPSLTKPSDHLTPSYSPHSPPYVRRSNRHSLTSSDLPEYRSIYSVEGHIPVAITKLDLTPTWRDNHSTSYEQPAASTTSLSEHLSALSISPRRNENRLPFRNFPGAQSSLNDSSASSSHSSHERPGDSASLSSPSPSTPTSNGTWLPPPPPPSPTFFFPGSRSVARPKVSSKITNSHPKKRKSKSKLRAGRSEISPTSPLNTEVALEIPPPSPIAQTPIQSNYPDTWSEEGAFVLSDDYKRQLAFSSLKQSSEKFVFPTARSRAQPKASSRPGSSKGSSHSSKSRDDHQGRSRFIETLFKRKGKARTPNITPIPKMYTTVSNSVASAVGNTSSKGKRISVESSQESTSTGQQERSRKMKSRRGSYPLDPYNSVLLDNDRYTGELLSRLNHTGSPSFHDYGTNPPSSVLDLGCGQGHWVLEAAVAWKGYGTHVTGYDMVDISRNLLPWATEQGVRDNIRFVRGNFLKQQLPFSSNTFDLVRMSCLALCITSDSWGFLLQEACRVLVAGGRLELIDDHLFFPYGKVSSLMDDANPIVASDAPTKLDSVLSPMASTFSIYGDVVVNPGLGSTVGHRAPDENDESDLEGEGEVLHGHHKGSAMPKIAAAQPRVKPSIILSPEAWDRCASISEDLEALFEHMLLDSFDIQKDPSDFILAMMERVFGQAREMEMMNLVLAPPNSTAWSDNLPQEKLSHCPGLILWPSTFIPMDHTEVEIHASKHLRTLLSCKNFLTQHAIEVAEDERVDEDFVSEALWEYESFLGHRFNPPVPASGHLDEESDAISIHGSIAESTNEAMWEIQSEFRQRYVWQPERPLNPPDTQHDTSVGTPSPPTSPPSASKSSAMHSELTHVRTFRVYEAVKLDNYTLTYDSY